MQLVNLMKHALRIFNKSTLVIDTYPGNETPVVLHSESKTVTDGEYAVETVVYGEILNLPDPQPGVVYVAPLMVKERAKLLGRTDVMSPSSGPTAVRFTEGPMKGQVDYVVSLSA